MENRLHRIESALHGLQDRIFILENEVKSVSDKLAVSDTAVSNDMRNVTTDIKSLSEKWERVRAVFTEKED
jgi:hypothetical protein